MPLALFTVPCVQRAKVPISSQQHRTLAMVLWVLPTVTSAPRLRSVSPRDVRLVTRLIVPRPYARHATPAARRVQQQQHAIRPVALQDTTSTRCHRHANHVEVTATCVQATSYVSCRVAKQVSTPSPLPPALRVPMVATCATATVLAHKTVVTRATSTTRELALGVELAVSHVRRPTHVNHPAVMSAMSMSPCPHRAKRALQNVIRAQVRAPARLAAACLATQTWEPFALRVAATVTRVQPTGLISVTQPAVLLASCTTLPLRHAERVALAVNHSCVRPMAKACVTRTCVAPDTTTSLRPSPAHLAPPTVSAAHSLVLAVVTRASVLRATTTLLARPRSVKLAVLAVATVRPTVPPSVTRLIARLATSISRLQRPALLAIPTATTAIQTAN